ncbi:aminotransferase class I/II-fold pyridoxal phosphate-dependent enzyme [Propionivibrio sp.]|uniref:aminotransferase class I/II-fold pyridoxal phosphate-dependent enzyme n=1 Tax=Propionivibrio sp. TaxID=2212460 RepID=UPI0039E342E2
MVNLTIGEPDYDTPDHVKTAAVDAIWRGDTKYTHGKGTLPLRRAIVQKFKRDNDLTYDVEEVFVGAGAKQVIYNAFATTLNHGDEVIIPAPYWVSYPDIAQYHGGQPVIVPCSESSGYKLRADALAAVITARTRWLVLNSPNNPTGAVYDEQELRALGDVLKRHPHVWVMTDDIYEHLRFSDSKFTTFAQAVPELTERVLTINGVSKAYAMTGWRIGYAGGPRMLIDAMSKLQSQSASCVTSISQEAARIALIGEQGSIRENVKNLHEKRDLALSILEGTQGLSIVEPEGAFYLFPSCAGLMGKRTADGGRIDSDDDLVLHLLEQGGVAVVSGSAYGLSPAFRISIATSVDELVDGCQRIRQCCNALV